MEERIVDCRGLACPQPVVETKRALDSVAVGRIKVLVDDEGAYTNVIRFGQSQGHKVSSAQAPSGHWEVLIEKIDREPTRLLEQGHSSGCEAKKDRSVVICISSEALGRGDYELGVKLMYSFLDTLAQFAQEVSHLVFMNTGVRLVIEGSPVLDEIQDLEGMGIKVLSCGTCLSYFDIAQKVKVGSISNMMEILEVLFKAPKVITT